MICGSTLERLEVMTMKISLIASSLALLLITPNVAYGCMCIFTPAVSDAYASADAVFSALGWETTPAAPAAK